MRRTNLALIALFTTLGMGPVNAGSDDEAMKTFGMLGRMAINCSATPSRENPHVVYAVSPQGGVTRTLIMEPDLNGTFVMRNVRLLAPDRLQFQEAGRRSEFVVTVAKIDGRFRTWQSVQADGTMLIDNGKFINGGTTSPVFEKCSG